LASGLRRPTIDDYESEAHRDGRFAERIAAVRDRSSGLFAVIGSLLSFGLILVLWAANISSCFRATSSVTQGAVPRAPRANDQIESRLTGHLTLLWRVSGGAKDGIDAWVLDDTSINAASLGAGTFILWIGLGALSDEQLDGVIAHELAHDKLQHSRKGAEVRDVTELVGEAIGLLGGSDEDTTRTLKQWSGSLVVPRYDRMQELEADAYAVDILAGRQYPNPAAVLCSAFGRLRSTVGEAGDGFFDSHPALTDRIRALREHFPSPATEASCK
jgi:Zn-dependent protease with chaperone function